MKISLKTIGIIAVLSLNAFAMCFSAIKLSNTTTVKKYNVPISNSVSLDVSSKKYYEIKKGDLYEYDSLQGEFQYESDAISDFALDEIEDLTFFSEVKKNQKIGVKDGSDVLSPCDGKIVFIDKSSVISIKIFDYSKLYVKLYLSYSEFYSMKFDSDVCKYSYGKKEYNLSFNRIELDSFTSTSVSVLFDITDNDIYIPMNTPVEIKKIKFEHKDAFYVENLFSISQYERRTYFVEKNGSIDTISFTCIKILPTGETIIEGDVIKEGMFFYE